MHYHHHHYPSSKKNSIVAVVAATVLVVSLIMPFAGQTTGTVPSASAADKAELPRHHRHHGDDDDNNNDDGKGGGGGNKNGGAGERTATKAACNCVIFRLDDVQDDWIVPVQSAIINEFLERKVPLDLAVIMNATGSDPAVVTKVRQAIASGLAETALHGWDHVDYRNLTLQAQYDTLKAANQKMQDLFGRKSVTFVPPYNVYDENTLKVMSLLGLKIISSEFDSEMANIYNPDNPDSPDNKVYRSLPNSNITDSQGIYHLPQVIGFYTYDSDPPTKTPLSLIKSQIDKTIASYGYAVVTLHPQDFTVKDASNNPTEELSKKEIKDLDTLITWVKDSTNYSIQTFSRASHVPLRPIVDKVPPDIMPPPDKSIVSSSKLTRVSNIGSPTVSDNADPHPSVKNNATRLGITGTSPYLFKQGTTKVTWTATDKAGNRSNATQYVTVAPTADKTAPTVEIDSPTNGTIITSKANASSSSVQIEMRGVAFDNESGVKVVEVRTNDTEYKVADQVVPGSWSSWTATVQTNQSSGDVEIEARVTDFFGNQQWDTHVVKVSPSG